MWITMHCNLLRIAILGLDWNISDTRYYRPIDTYHLNSESSITIAVIIAIEAAAVCHKLMAWKSLRKRVCLWETLTKREIAREVKMLWKVRETVIMKEWNSKRNRSERNPDGISGLFRAKSDPSAIAAINKMLYAIFIDNDLITFWCIRSIIEW